MFILLAAIFLSSTGFLIGAALAPTPAVVPAPAPAPGSGEGATTIPQSRLELRGAIAPLTQHDPAPPPPIRRPVNAKV